MVRIRVRPIPEPGLLSGLNALCERLGLRPARVSGDAVYVTCESKEQAARLAEQLARDGVLGRALVAELVEGSAFFDEDGLFADGAADPSRRGPVAHE
jgi:hypothetical protein